MPHPPSCCWIAIVTASTMRPYPLTCRWRTVSLSARICFPWLVDRNGKVRDGLQLRAARPYWIPGPRDTAARQRTTPREPIPASHRAQHYATEAEPISRPCQTFSWNRMSSIYRDRTCPPTHMLQNSALGDQGGAQARRAGGRPAAPLTAAARHPHRRHARAPSHGTSASPWPPPRTARGSFNTGPPASRALLRRVAGAMASPTLDTDDPALTDGQCEGTDPHSTRPTGAPAMRHLVSPNQLVLWPHHELTQAWAPTGIRYPLPQPGKNAGGHDETKRSKVRRRSCRARSVLANRPEGAAVRCKTREDVQSVVGRSGLLNRC